jgi:hypothetical protein
MTKKIDVKQLRENMFICGTDRKWLEIPFFRRKFLITSVDQIYTLREYCKFVYIDIEKGVDVLLPPEDDIIIEHKISVDPDLSAQGGYALGCAVELNSGEIGIVAHVNPQDRLRPTLSMVTNAQKQLLTQQQDIDLSGKTTQGLEIIKTLAPDDPIVELLLALHANSL